MPEATPRSPELSHYVSALACSIENPSLVNTWEPDRRGDFRCAVVEAADPDAAGLDPLAFI